MTFQSRLTIVFPAYHHPLKTIKRTLTTLNRFAAKHHWHFSYLILQNGDAKPYSLHVSNTHCFFLPQKGFAAALKLGLSQVTTPYFLFTSPDLPFGTKDLEQMLPLKNKYTLIIGSKLHPRSHYLIALNRRLSSRFLHLLTRLVLPGFPVADPNGSLFGQTAMCQPLLPLLTQTSFAICTELIYLLYLHKATFYEVPITYRSSTTPSSIRLHDGLDYLCSLIRIRRHHSSNI